MMLALVVGTSDIYGPAEDFIGDFRHKLSVLKDKEEELNKIQALTKYHSHG
jgi:hypothetical protein